MGDETVQTNSEARASPRKLRNHSYKESQSTNNTKMSGIIFETNKEEEEDHKLIMKEDFTKKNTAQKTRYHG